MKLTFLDRLQVVLSTFCSIFRYGITEALERAEDDLRKIKEME